MQAREGAIKAAQRTAANQARRKTAQQTGGEEAPPTSPTGLDPSSPWSAPGRCAGSQQGGDGGDDTISPKLGKDRRSRRESPNGGSIPSTAGLQHLDSKLLDENAMSRSTLAARRGLGGLSAATLSFDQAPPIEGLADSPTKGRVASQSPSGKKTRGDRGHPMSPQTAPIDGRKGKRGGVPRGSGSRRSPERARQAWGERDSNCGPP